MGFGIVWRGWLAVDSNLEKHSRKAPRPHGLAENWGDTNTAMFFSVPEFAFQCPSSRTAPAAAGSASQSLSEEIDEQTGAAAASRIRPTEIR